MHLLMEDVNTSIDRMLACVAICIDRTTHNAFTVIIIILLTIQLYLLYRVLEQGFSSVERCPEEDYSAN